MPPAAFHATLADVQPVEELEAANVRSLLGICFDIDDTVTTQGILDRDAYASLFALREAGLKLLAVTGRPLGFAEVFARTWPIDAAVGENGAGFIAHSAQGTCTIYWDDEATRRAQAGKLAQLREALERELPQMSLSTDMWARRCDLAYDIGEYARPPEQCVERLVEIAQAHGARTTVSSVHAHAQFGDHDKARGAARAIETLWQIDPEQARRSFLFVGDSGNDAAPFAWFKHTVGVANVVRHLDRLPTPPRFVTKDACGAGFAEVAALVLARRQTSRS